MSPWVVSLCGLGFVGSGFLGRGFAGLGFSAGVFAGTMEGMPNYTDLNTNGIILTAIGHALR